MYISRRYARTYTRARKFYFFCGFANLIEAGEKKKKLREKEKEPRRLSVRPLYHFVGLNEMVRSLCPFDARRHRPFHYRD